MQDRLRCYTPLQSITTAHCSSPLQPLFFCFVLLPAQMQPHLGYPPYRAPQMPNELETKGWGVRDRAGAGEGEEKEKEKEKGGWAFISTTFWMMAASASRWGAGDAARLQKRWMDLRSIGATPGGYAGPPPPQNNLARGRLGVGGRDAGST
jgi:hypothetical protein